MNDFDHIFDPQYSAVDLFTNRIAEHTAFADALRSQLDGVRAGSAVLGQPERRNVLVFYGIGGIGKTELSRRLERWAAMELADPGDWGPPPEFERPVRTARVDFHGSRVVDAIGTVLRLRAAAAEPGRRFPAFDLGLAAWWAMAHPGTALPELRGAQGFDVRQQMTDTLTDILNDAGAKFGIGPLTVRTAISIVDAVRTGRLRGRLLRECRPLAAIVEEAQRNASPYVAATLAGLLSWDLETSSPDDRPLMVAFADAFEYVQGADRSQERLFNRIVHLTPGVLWVVTSRNRLDWASPGITGLLPATGGDIWPGLRMEAADDPRQHLVGDLSDTDVERYLIAAASSPGNPGLGPAAIANIRQGAHGLPLYLDLSFAIARASAADAPDPSVFGGPLPELVTRVFANMPDRERDLARVASLLPRFDARLLADASTAQVGDAERLCRQSLVTRDDHPLFPYRLHDAVRSAVGGESIAERGAWAPEDRGAAARDLVGALRRRADGLLGDVDRRLDVLELAAFVCAEHDMREPWLATALSELPGFARTAERLPPATPGTWMGQLSGLYEAWRGGRLVRERIAYLESYLAGPLDEDISRRGRLRLAYSYRTIGDAATCLRLLTQLLDEDGESELHRYQVARTLHSLGEYDALQRHLERYPLREESTARRLRGDLAFDRGLLEEAAAAAAFRARHLRAVGQHRIALENESSVVWRRALHGSVTPGECDDLLTEADRYGDTLLMRTALAAKIIRAAGDSSVVDGLLAESQAVIDAKTGHWGWREFTALAVHVLRTGDRDQVEGLHARWMALDLARSTNYQVVDRFFVFAGFPARYPPLSLGSGEDASVTDARWHGIIQALVAPATRGTG